MGVAEDISAVSAVMPSLPQVEALLAHRRVADGGTGVGLPVRAIGWTGHFRQAGCGYGGLGGVFVDFVERGAVCFPFAV